MKQYGIRALALLLGMLMLLGTAVACGKTEDPAQDPAAATTAAANGETVTTTAPKRWKRLRSAAKTTPTLCPHL